MALEIARAHADHPGTRSEAGQGVYGTELPVRSKSGNVRGRIDAVVPSPHGPVVRDYKSGVISDEAGAALPEYEAQLRLYAALYAQTTGIWPARLEIVSLVGKIIQVDFLEAQCNALLAEAEQLLETTNLRMDTAESAVVAQTRLASPSDDACRYCRYRPVCKPYLELARGYPGPCPRDVIGVAEGVYALGNSKVLLTIQTSTVEVRIRGLEPGRHPTLTALPIGIEVGVFDARVEGPSLTLAEGPATTIYMLGEAGRA
jgi:hypothetical protein